MSSNVKTTIIITGITFIIFFIIAAILYKNFFKEIDVSAIDIPPAEILRFSEPVELPSFRFINQQHQFINIKQNPSSFLVENKTCYLFLPCLITHFLFG